MRIKQFVMIVAIAAACGVSAANQGIAADFEPKGRSAAAPPASNPGFDAKLNSVLRISGEPDYGVLNIFRAQIGAGRRAVWSAGPGKSSKP